MSKSFFEEASHAAAYAIYRPSYSKELVRHIMETLSHKRPSDYDGKWNQLVDLGCGSGQSTLPFLTYFRQALATDPSANQIAEAIKKISSETEELRFEVGVAEKVNVEDSSVDLVIAGQAAHWFDMAGFLKECRRILFPGGLAAIFGYSTPVIGSRHKFDVSDETNALNATLYRFYRRLDWPADRRHVETRYEGLELPDLALGLDSWREAKALTLNYEWPLDDFFNYVDTWSGYRRLLKRDPDNVSLLEELKTEVARLNGEGSNLQVNFDVFVVFYRKRKQSDDA